MFLLGTKVVYPGHGVARVNQIVKRVISGSIAQFYELVFVNKEMTILVPVRNIDSVGIRELSSTEKINDILTFIGQPVIKKKSLDSVVNNWNKRNKEYHNKLRTGNLLDISSIYRDLKQIELDKELSFGEKSILQKTEGLLAQEIALATEISSEELAVQQLRAAFNSVANKEHWNSAKP